MANTTADKLALLAANKTAIKAAINAKNPTTAPTDVMSQWPTAIASIPSGGGVTVEALSVTENGTYDGTSQGKAYSPVAVAVDDIWPVAWKNDGKTHLWFFYSAGDRLLAYFTAQYISNGHTFLVEWGDGTSQSIAASTAYTTRTISHTYASAGYKEVVISGYDSISYNQGYAFGNTENYASQKAIRQVELGGEVATACNGTYPGPGIRYFKMPNMTSVGGNAFVGSGSLVSVGSLSNVTSVGQSFTGCANFVGENGHLDLSSVTTLSSHAFRGCASIRTVSDIIATDAGNDVFNGCSSLVSVGDMSNMTRLNTSFFNGCSSLESVGDLSGITGNVASGSFSGCVSMKSLIFRNKTHTEVQSISGFSSFPNLGLRCIFHCSDGDYYRDGYYTLAPVPAT